VDSHCLGVFASLDIVRLLEATTVDSKQNPPWRQQAGSGFSRLNYLLLSVVHSKLFYKLTKYGISCCLLMWIYAFSTNRYQCVIIEHCFSEWSPVISVVPQVYVLGPILFIMYIDDIFEVFLGSAATHQLFADDLKLFSKPTVKTSANAASLQSTLDRLQQWCANWQLTINTQKCFVLHLGFTNSQLQYTLNGCLINDAHNITDLVVDIDCNLKYDTHINNIISKAYTLE